MPGYFCALLFGFGGAAAGVIKEVYLMAKTCVPFHGTKEQEEALLKVIENHREQKGALMPILQEAQEIYGYLPIEVQKIIALQLDIPLEEVYGVATFYSQFTLNPKGQYKISVCLGTACYVKGGECTPDGKFSLEACRCIGACGLAPVLTINDEVYGRLTVDDVDTILAKYADK